MDGNTTTFGNITNDTITWNRITTFGNPDQEPRSTLDDNSTLMLHLKRILVLYFYFATLDQFFCFCLSLGTLFFTTFFFRQTVEDGNGSDFSKTNGCKESFFCLVASFLQDFIHVALVHKFISHIAVFLELTNQHFTTFIGGQFFILIFKELTNFVAGLAGLNHVKPVTAWSKWIWIGNDFNLVPCFQLGSQRYHTTIDLGTSRFFPNLGMNLIGKVNRSRILWKRTNRPIWSKDINLFCQIVFFDSIYKFLGIIRLVLELHHLLDPVHPNGRFLAINLTFHSFFVGPVSRNPVLSNLVHFLGSNLELNWPFRSINSRMDRLVTIGLTIGNVVLETSWHWFP